VLTWQQLSSGVYVPGSVSERIHIPNDLGEPAELVPRPAPVAIYDRRPSSDEQVLVRPSATDLGFPEATLAAVVALLRDVPFEPAMIALCRLHAMNWSIARDGRAQLDLAREFFGENELIERFAAFLTQPENGVLFSEQEFFIVQRLLVEEAEDGPLDDGMDRDAFVTLATAIVMARSIVDGSHADLEREQPGEDAILAYLVQNGAYFEGRNLLNSFARSYSVFIEHARALAGEGWACPLDEWIAEDSTLNLESSSPRGLLYRRKARRSKTTSPPASGASSILWTFSRARRFAAVRQTWRPRSAHPAIGTRTDSESDVAIFEPSPGTARRSSSVRSSSSPTGSLA